MIQPIHTYDDLEVVVSKLTSIFEAKNNSDVLIGELSEPAMVWFKERHHHITTGGS